MALDAKSWASLAAKQPVEEKKPMVYRPHLDERFNPKTYLPSTSSLKSCKVYRDGKDLGEMQKKLYFEKEANSKALMSVFDSIDGSDEVLLYLSTLPLDVNYKDYYTGYTLLMRAV
jgi:hypothetical protein